MSNNFKKTIITIITLFAFLGLGIENSQAQQTASFTNLHADYYRSIAVFDFNYTGNVAPGDTFRIKVSKNSNMSSFFWPSLSSAITNTPPFMTASIVGIGAGCNQNIYWQAYIVNLTDGTSHYSPVQTTVVNCTATPPPMVTPWPTPSVTPTATPHASGLPTPRVSFTPISSATPTVSPSPRITPTATANSGKIQKVISDINRKISALEKQLRRIENLKEVIPPNEYSVLITQVQKYIQKLNDLKASVNAQSANQVYDTVQSLNIYTKVIPQIQIRRKAALLYAYTGVLSEREQDYYKLIETKKNDQQFYGNAVKCVVNASTLRQKGLGLLNGVLSQIGLIEINTDNKIIRDLAQKLNRQLDDAKRQLDSSRRELSSCYRLLGAELNPTNK